MAKTNLSVRSLPYPAVEDGNFSFPEAVYTASPQLVGVSGTEVKITHTISGAPLIESLIEAGKAKYGCTVAVPKTGYRKLELAESDVQTISWDLDIVGEPPILGPVLLYVGEKELRKLKESDGIAKIWAGRKVEFTKGFRLARDQYLRPSGSMQNLIHVACKKDLDSGVYTVTENTNHGFYFTLHAAEDIFNLLQNPQGRLQGMIRRCVITHAVSQCFNILKHDYGESDEDDSDSTKHWNQYSNLHALADWLAEKGVGHWSDDGFDAMETATRIYPADVPRTNE